jgi:hypothetical protein
MDELINLAKARLPFFKKGDNRYLEKLREGKQDYGFLDYKENIVIPNLIKFGFFKDKKTLRIDTDFGLIDDLFFNFLLGQVKYNGNVIRWSREIKNLKINNATLSDASIKNVTFGDRDLEAIRFSNCIFEKVEFNCCKFYNTNLSLSVFKGCIFESCFFVECDFEGSLWGGNKEEIEKGKIEKNKVNLCYYNKCSVSTSEGVGKTPFFNEIMNNILDKNNKKWNGSAVYKDMNSNLKLLEEGK